MQSPQANAIHARQSGFCWSNPASARQQGTTLREIDRDKTAMMDTKRALARHKVGTKWAQTVHGVWALQRAHDLVASLAISGIPACLMHTNKCIANNYTTT